MNNNSVTKEEFEKFIEKHTIGYALNLEDYKVIKCKEELLI